MQAVDAVLVVQRQVFEQRNLAAEVGAHGVHDVFADLAAAVGDAGIQQDAHGLQRARGEHDDARLHAMLGAGLAVDVDARLRRCRPGASLIARTMASVTMSRLPVSSAGGRCTVVDW